MNQNNPFKRKTRSPLVPSRKNVIPPKGIFKRTFTAFDSSEWETEDAQSEPTSAFGAVESLRCHVSSAPALRNNVWQEETKDQDISSILSVSDFFRRVPVACSTPIDHSEQASEVTAEEVPERTVASEKQPERTSGTCSGLVPLVVDLCRDVVTSVKKIDAITSESATTPVIKTSNLKTYQNSLKEIAEKLKVPQRSSDCVNNHVPKTISSVGNINNASKKVTKKVKTTPRQPTGRKNPISDCSTVFDRPDSEGEKITLAQLRKKSSDGLKKRIHAESLHCEPPDDTSDKATDLASTRQCLGDVSSQAVKTVSLLVSNNNEASNEITKELKTLPRKSTGISKKRIHGESSHLESSDDTSDEATLLASLHPSLGDQDQVPKTVPTSVNNNKALKEITKKSKTVSRQSKNTSKERIHTEPLYFEPPYGTSEETSVPASTRQSPGEVSNHVSKTASRLLSNTNASKEVTKKIKNTPRQSTDALRKATHVDSPYLDQILEIFDDTAVQCLPSHSAAVSPTWNMPSTVVPLPKPSKKSVTHRQRTPSQRQKSQENRKRSKNVRPNSSKHNSETPKKQKSPPDGSLEWYADPSFICDLSNPASLKAAFPVRVNGASPPPGSREYYMNKGVARYLRNYRLANKSHKNGKSRARETESRSQIRENVSK